MHELRRSFLPSILRTGLVLVLALSTSAIAENRDSSRRGAPEIDPGLSAAGIVILVGGTLVLTGRRRPSTT